MNDLVDRDTGEITAPSGAAQGLVTREANEVIAMVMACARAPRNVVAARSAIVNAFSRPKLADAATYAYARGGAEITGPSIRAAEAIAQYWGSMSFGYRILSESLVDGIGVTEVQAFALDYESRLRREATFTVRHVRNTKRGQVKLTDDRDVYELVANMAARRVRACVLAVIPADIIDDAMEQAGVTQKSSADTSPEAMAVMLERFAEFEVTREMIEKRIQRSLESIAPAQVVSLRNVYRSLRDGMSRVSTWFDVGPSVAPAASGMAAVKDAMATPATPAGPAGGPVTDVADILKRIRASQDFHELQVMDEVVGNTAFTNPDDQRICIEALRHRDAQLAERTTDGQQQTTSPPLRGDNEEQTQRGAPRGGRAQQRTRQVPDAGEGVGGQAGVGGGSGNAGL